METETRVHAICHDCLSLKPNTREPIAIDFPHCWMDTCCFCGQRTQLGFYYRDVEQPTAHCRCDAYTVHPGYTLTDTGSEAVERKRRQRTAQYYDSRGKSYFDVDDMQDGDIDEYLSGEDDA